MASYAIFRHGSNSANQSMTERLLVDLIEAKSAEAAVTESKVDCYNNQYLSAKPASRLTAEEKEELRSFEELEAQWNEILQPSQVGCLLCGKHPDRPMSQREAENYYCGCQSR
jgi:hypothetical protein